MFMDDNEVRDIIGPTSLHQLTHHVVATIQTLRVGENETQLLLIKKKEQMKISFTNITHKVCCVKCVIFGLFLQTWQPTKVCVCACG